MAGTGRHQDQGDLETCRSKASHGTPTPAFGGGVLRKETRVKNIRGRPALAGTSKGDALRRPYDWYRLVCREAQVSQGFGGVARRWPFRPTEGCRIGLVCKHTRQAITIRPTNYVRGADAGTIRRLRKKPDSIAESGLRKEKGQRTLFSLPSVSRRNPASPTARPCMQAHRAGKQPPRGSPRAGRSNVYGRPVGQKPRTVRPHLPLAVGYFVRRPA